MPLRRAFLLSISVLVACNVLLAFGAIGLFTRMSPAIERILRENIYSTEVAEDMLALLAEPAADAQLRQRRFAETLQRAWNNVTEPEEVPTLERIEQYYRTALAGDANAIGVVVRALQHLIVINRQAMITANQEAQRLGAAGAWVAVFIAIFSFVISLLVIRRLERYVLNPLIELYDVLEAVRIGNYHRRCRVGEAPEEIRRVLNSVNTLLDRTMDSADSTAFRRPLAQMTSERGALLYLLEERPEAMLVVDAHGDVVASNSRGLAALGSTDGERFKQLLGTLPIAPTADARIVPIDLKGAVGWLCVLRPENPAPRAG